MGTSRSCKGKKTDSPLEPPEGASPAHTWISAPGQQCWTSDLQKDAHGGSTPDLGPGRPESQPALQYATGSPLATVCFWETAFLTPQWSNSCSLCPSRAAHRFCPWLPVKGLCSFDVILQAQLPQWVLCFVRVTHSRGHIWRQTRGP